MKRDEITADIVRALFDYDPETGELTRKASLAAPKAKSGDVIRYYDGAGYISLKVHCFRFRAHRLAWVWMTGEWPPNDVDHINGIRDDNRWCNLRLATRKQNATNRRRVKTNTSGFPGVSLFGNRWGARVTDHLGRRIFLGLFDTPQEAAEVQQAEHRRIHGEFSPF